MSVADEIVTKYSGILGNKGIGMMPEEVLPCSKNMVQRAIKLDLVAQTISENKPPKDDLISLYRNAYTSLYMFRSAEDMEVERRYSVAKAQHEMKMQDKVMAGESGAEAITADMSDEYRELCGKHTDVMIRAYEEADHLHQDFLDFVDKMLQGTLELDPQ